MAQCHAPDFRIAATDSCTDSCTVVSARISLFPVWHLPACHGTARGCTLSGFSLRAGGLPPELGAACRALAAGGRRHMPRPRLRRRALAADVRLTARGRWTASCGRSGTSSCHTPPTSGAPPPRPRQAHGRTPADSRGFIPRPALLRASTPRCGGLDCLRCGGGGPAGSPRRGVAGITCSDVADTMRGDVCSNAR